MTAGSLSPHTLMIRKLESTFTFADEEKQALQNLPIQVTNLKAGRDIVRVGDRPSQCCLILEGFSCVYKLTSEGKRQLVALHVPGDIPDLQSLHLEVMDNSIALISPCTVGFIQHEDLRCVCERYPRLTAAFWRETLVDASIFREWLLNNGRREAYTRMAHLLCEFLMRLKAVGLVEDDAFDLPITQVELADAIGTSSVHVNRVLQALRGDGLVQTKGKQVIVPDWEKLKEAGDFDPLYLHLEDVGAARSPAVA
ncbi:Crp/Fnr family transcriptional regulator [Modicisalibacter luteus]|uniref:Crp/Fnr family transcriptional regulator n=1 Tax=Modicisalibacter luteus TaxID=453962 RepID=A0ABV7M5D8_9GAMM|nr:Crp/Fnr family transcriptional regulator [Halomonas lutea]GHB13701.1 Crp/Fnr family transcriptional regulator [Halomonas lutea]